MATGTSKQFLIRLFSFPWNTRVSNGHGGEEKMTLKEEKKSVREKKSQTTDIQMAVNSCANYI